MDCVEKKIGSKEVTEELCRICLLNNEKTQNIFIDENNLHLLEKLIFYGGIEAFENDGLPNRICFPCISKINATHDFRMQCQNADKKLRQLLGKSPKHYTVSILFDKIDKSCQTNTEDFDVLTKIIEVDETKNTNTENYKCDYNSGLCNYKDPHLGPELYYIYKTKHNSENDETKKKISSHRKSLMTRKDVFKQVNSMENIIIRPQRHYVKKSSKIKPNDSKYNEIDTTHDFNLLNVSNLDCSSCKKSFENIISLEAHDCDITDLFECSVCNEDYQNTKQFLEHEKSHEFKTMKCLICDKIYRKANSMVRHLNLHKKNDSKLKTPAMQDDENLKLENEFRETKENNECNSESYEIIQSQKYICDTSSEFHKNVNEYLESSSSVTFDKCEYQNNYNLKKTTEENSISLEIMNSPSDDTNAIHNEQQNNIKKIVKHLPEKSSLNKPDSKLIKNWNSTKLDGRINGENKGLFCKVCENQKFFNESKSSDLSIFEKDKSNCLCSEKLRLKREKTKPYSCSKCKKSFQKESKLIKHQKSHERVKEQDSNFKRFLCHICSKTFRQNTGLMFHMRTHTGYKPHVCKYCGRGFTSNSNCINHERTHTGDRPFVCHFCSAAFAKSCTLKAHITTHTGEANYHCKTCGKSFRRLKYLKEHRYTHTGEKPYACKLCGTAYSHSGSLFVHEKKCKAHFNNSIYQSCISKSVTTTVESVQVTPVITSISDVNESGENFSKVISENKVYVENVHSPLNHIILDENQGLLRDHQSANIQDISSVRNFTIVGQIFYP